MQQTKSNFRKLVLPNGLRVLLYKMEDVRSFYALLYVRSGGLFESKNQKGISHLVEHMAFVGTKKYPNAEILNKTAENLGILYGGGTSKDSTYYSVGAPFMNYKKALDILGEFVFNPILDEEQLAIEKQVVLTEYADFWSDPVSRYEHEFMRKRFKPKEHEYSIRPMGKPETIKGLNPAMALACRSKYYTPANMTLSVAGNFDQDGLVRELKTIFAKGKKGKAHKEPKFKTDDYSNFLVYHQNDERSQISFDVSFPAFGWRQISRKERITLRLLNMIVGSTGSSRLYLRLREKERLVYKMFSSRRLLSWMGALVIGGSTPLDKLEKTLKIIREEIDSVVKSGVNESELELVKNLSIAQTFMQFDNPSAIANYFMDEVYFEDKMLFPEERNRLIRQVTVKDVNSLAKKLFSFSRVNIGLLGRVPPKTIKNIERIFKN